MANKAYEAVMSGKCDNNIKFSDLRKVLENAGFQCRIKGDHFIYTRSDIADIVNIQPIGNKAKAYQVKQVRILFQTYNI